LIEELVDTNYSERLELAAILVWNRKLWSRN